MICTAGMSMSDIPQGFGVEAVVEGWADPGDESSGDQFPGTQRRQPAPENVDIDDSTGPGVQQITAGKFWICWVCAYVFDHNPAKEGGYKEKDTKMGRSSLFK